jgi:hypothetical protein
MRRQQKESRMSASKKWMGFAALGAATAALFSRLWHRDDRGDTPPKQAGPVDTVD